jgi:hypothetical protein
MRALRIVYPQAQAKRPTGGARGAGGGKCAAKPGARGSAAPRKKPRSWPRCCPSGTIRSGSRSGPTRGARSARRFEHIKGPRDWQLGGARAHRAARAQAGVRARERPAARDLALGVLERPRPRQVGARSAWSRTGTEHASRLDDDRRGEHRRPDAHEDVPRVRRVVRQRGQSHWFTIETLRIVPAPWLLELVRSRRRKAASRSTRSIGTCRGRRGRRTTRRVRRHAQPARPARRVRRGERHPLRRVGHVSRASSPKSTRTASGSPRRRCAIARGACLELFDDKQIGHGWRTRTLSTRGMDGVDQALVADQIRATARTPTSCASRSTACRRARPRTSSSRGTRCARRSSNELLPRLRRGARPRRRPGAAREDAWRFRQGRNARDCCGSATHGHWLGKDNVQIAKAIWISTRSSSPTHICIDFGMGTGVIDILKRKPLHGRVHEVKFGDTAHDGKDGVGDARGRAVGARSRVAARRHDREGRRREGNAVAAADRSAAGVERARGQQEDPRDEGGHAVARRQVARRRRRPRLHVRSDSDFFR